MDILRSKLSERPEHDPTIEGIYGSKGFFFQQRRGHLDLRGISNMDLEKVVREVDVDSLQLYIENITFCNLREEDLRYLTDPQVIKVFKMSQLIIEYLLYSQDLFVANLGELSKKYVAKKKSLSKKRRELAELEEATKHLRNQVKAKKQNISTLEDLLRENARRGPKEAPAPRLEEPRPARSDKLSFFVAGPEGLCVEFHERPDTTIYSLRKAVSQAFISKRDVEGENFNKVVRLVHRGIVLLDDKSIESYGVRTGDTVVAVLERVEEKKAPAPQPAQEATKDSNLMFEVLSKQHDSLQEFAKDMRHGWENALLAAKGNRDGDLNFAESERRLAARMDDKWALYENGRLQLEAKLNELLLMKNSQTVVVEQQPSVQVIHRRGRMGELESDDDAPVLNDINDKLARFGSQLNKLEVHSVVTDRSIDDLRDSLRHRPAPVTAAAAAPAPKVQSTQPVIKIEITPPPSAAPTPEPRKSGEMKTLHSNSSAIKPHHNKWNDLDAIAEVKAASVVVEKNHAEVDMGSMEVPVEAPKPAPVVQSPPAKAKAAPKAKPEAKPAVRESKPAAKKVEAKPEAKPAVPMVDVVFPAVYHTDDMSVFHGDKVLTVQLPQDLPPDDVVFVLRKEIANKVQVPLTRVTLVLRGKNIIMDVDTGDEALTVQSVKTYASNGVLIFKVNKGKPLTNAQLDLLVPAWQRASSDNDVAKVETPAGAAAASEKKRKLKKRRDWDDDDVQDNDPQLLSKNMYTTVRGSLDEALSGVSDREGLTDDELHQKMESLKLFTETLPSNVADHLKNYRGKVTNSIAQATIDSGSEDLLPRISLLQKELSGGVGESLSMKRSRTMSISRIGRAAESPVPTAEGAGLLRRSIEDYNSEEDFVGRFSQVKEDSPAMASVTNSTDMRAQLRSAAAKSVDSTRGSAAGRSDAKGEKPLVNTTSTTDSLLYSPSQSIASATRATRYTGSDRVADLDSQDDEDEEEYSDDEKDFPVVSRVAQTRKGSRGSHDEGKADKTMLSSIATLPSVDGNGSDEEHYGKYLRDMDEVDSEVGDFNDLSQTVDSEGEGLARDRGARAGARGARRVDENERDAARTPPSRARAQSQATHSNTSKASNVSLFNNLQGGEMLDDLEDSVHSLAFSNNGDD